MEIDLIKEEIATNILRKSNQIYEEYGEQGLVEYFDNLTEEEHNILSEEEESFVSGIPGYNLYKRYKKGQLGFNRKTAGAAVKDLGNFADWGGGFLRSNPVGWAGLIASKPLKSAGDWISGPDDEENKPTETPEQKAAREKAKLDLKKRKEKVAADAGKLGKTNSSDIKPTPSDTALVPGDLANKTKEVSVNSQNNVRQRLQNFPRPAAGNFAVSKSGQEVLKKASPEAIQSMGRTPEAPKSDATAAAPETPKPDAPTQTATQAATPKPAAPAPQQAAPKPKAPAPVARPQRQPEQSTETKRHKAVLGGSQYGAWGSGAMYEQTDFRNLVHKIMKKGHESY